MANEKLELRRILKGETGREFLQSFPLVEAYIESTTIINILRQSCRSSIRTAEDQLGIEIALGCFGSLGRLEFVAGHSDLDPLILFRSKGKSLPSSDAIREAVLRPLCKTNPWLVLDDSEKVGSGRWEDISNCALKYPVYSVDNLVDSDDQLARQRKWQLLLETRCLYNEAFLATVRAQTVKQLPAIAAGSASHGSATTTMNYGQLINGVPEFYAGFENPAFLFKSPFKYWKTRFLREYYAFSNNLNFVLGWYLERNSEHITLDYFNSSTAVKMSRATRFAQQLEGEARANSGLRSLYQEKLQTILRQWELDESPLLLFGRDYATEPARLLHGLIAAVLSRFSVCWERLYHAEVQSALVLVPQSDVNFDARFKRKCTDSATEMIVAELFSLRDSYLRYMGATAQAVVEIFPKGRLWSYGTVPAWLRDALEPFAKKI